MRGPLHALWNTRLVGTYLRFRVAFALAGLLAIGAGIVALGIGGVLGMLVLLLLVLLGLALLGAILLTR
jgi:hypothetical protein